MRRTHPRACLLLLGQAWVVVIASESPADTGRSPSCGDDAATCEMLLLQSSFSWGKKDYEKLFSNQSQHDILDYDAHPLWVFDWALLCHGKVLLGACLLFVAGVLSAAGGIGGGGIYVSVIVLAVPLEDAVPLSKAVILIGSIITLILNLRKSGAGQVKLIDYNVCSLVVPASLVGTYVGVILNWLVPEQIIKLILAIVLIGMSVRLIKMTYDQYTEEISNCRFPASLDAPSTPPNDSRGDADVRPSDKQKFHWKTTPRFHASALDLIFGCGSLLLVIAFSTLRFYATLCAHSLAKNYPELTTDTRECNHPVIAFLRGKLQEWMARQQSAQFVEDLSFCVPLCSCILVAFYYTRKCIREEAWRLGDAFSFQAMAFATGILAGLVGIGGGLIFSPFFLLMGMDAHVAVATSSTCVVFTASSTAFQYLLTNRIIMSLAVIYGSVSLLASFIGTNIVHNLQDTNGSRRSYVTCIVAVGVAVSAVLTCITLFKGGEAASATH